MRATMTCIRRATYGAALVALVACGGGPTGPAEPFVSGVSPAQGRPGEHLTISGSWPGAVLGGVTVTFDGTAGAVVSVTNSTIVVVVPNVPEGDASIVVTVSGRSSTAATISILRALPVITIVTPASVRQGSTLSIFGQNLLASVGLGPSGAATGPSPAGAAVEVLLDGAPLAPQSVTAQQIVVEIPITTSLGDHEIQVRHGTDVSNALDVTVEVFTVTGEYDFLGLVRFNNCPPDLFPFETGEEIGSFATVSEIRPNVTVTLRAEPHTPVDAYRGTLEADGTFEASFAGGDFDGTFSELEGTFRLGEGEVILAGTSVIRNFYFDGPDSECRSEVEFVGARVSTTVGDVRPALQGRELAAPAIGDGWARRE